MRLAFMGSPGFRRPRPAGAASAPGTRSPRSIASRPARPAAARRSAAARCTRRRATRAAGAHAGRACATTPQAQAAFAALDLDAAVVAAYGLILPQAMLDAPRRGCLNIHASLLPRWRGAAPIQAAILAGDPETGITIMQMDAGLDTGPMLLRQAVPITPPPPPPALHDALAALGARPDPARSRPTAAARAATRADATYAPKLTREDGRIDWSQPRRRRSIARCAPSTPGPARSPCSAARR